MQWLYTIGIYGYVSLLYVVLPFNKKAKQFIEGRKNVFQNLRKALLHNQAKKRLWFHAASVGEFEQCRVLIELIKKQHPNYFITITFFSPSGYELRKNYPYADHICYLPIDSANNAKAFLDILQPDLVFFAKYEFWHFYISELKKRTIPILSISSIFRHGQIYFKNSEGFYARILKNINFFFVQNEQSLQLLKSINIMEAVVNGDTRFDRVQQIAQLKKGIPQAASFKNNDPIIVCGSTWKEDMEVLTPFINKHHKRLKFIIAPHEVHTTEIDHYIKQIQCPSIKFSEYETNQSSENRVLWIDNIGMLSSLYQYGDFAYIGGAFGNGLHNTLEAATFGLPVFFGNKKYKKFQEALDLIHLNTGFAINDTTDFETRLLDLFDNKIKYNETQKVINTYIQENIGASHRIFEYCQKNFFDASESN